MNESKIYDIIGIGIGPFNLGMATLAAELPKLDCLFIDQNPEFNWHPGIMLQTARMQVPFYADLVTLASARSPFSFMNWLKETGRLFRFAISENNFPYRSEYNEYCQWVVAKLSNLHFGWACMSIVYDSDHFIYEVSVKHQSSGNVQLLHGKHIVLGTGTAPSIPSGISESANPLIFHSGNYLNNKATLLKKENITLVGSGQSAAEIFLDLMSEIDDKINLHWFTRSERFHPMDYSRFSLEMSSPDYVNYFYNLGSEKKLSLLKGQEHLYKGINSSLIDQIYECLYLKGMNKNKDIPGLRTSCELKNVETWDNSAIRLSFHHLETNKTFEHSTESLILATGYHYKIPEFIEPLKNHIHWLVTGKYHLKRDFSIDRNNTLFVQNADLHSHGFNSADLGLGPYRNAIILNTILQEEYFKIERGSNFQQFG